MLRRFFILAVLSGTFVAVAHAQIAADSTQNYPATVGSGIWNNGDNRGFGFQPWQFFSTNGHAGIFIGDSMQNGGPFTPSLGINSPNGRSWGLFANSGGASSVVRPFVTAVDIGQTFGLDFDNGFIDNGGSEGFALSDNNTGQALWQFLFTGGQNVYQVIDSRGAVDTTLPFTADGMHIDFTLTGTATYSATIHEADGAFQTITGSLAKPGSVSRFSFFDNNAGFNSSNNVYANNLAIVPEPSVLALLFFGALLAVRQTIRRH